MVRVGKRNGKLKEGTHVHARAAELNICNTMWIPAMHVTKLHHVCWYCYVNIYTVYVQGIKNLFC